MEPKETLMQRIAKSKWSPMSILTDEQYEEMLQEKLLRVEAEIAMVDDRIEAMKKQARQAEARRKLEGALDEAEAPIARIETRIAGEREKAMDATAIPAQQDKMNKK